MIQIDLYYSIMLPFDLKWILNYLKDYQIIFGVIFIKKMAKFAQSEENVQSTEKESRASIRVS